MLPDPEPAAVDFVKVTLTEQDEPEAMIELTAQVPPVSNKLLLLMDMDFKVVGTVAVFVTVKS